jgi:DNA-binding transcriptional ArsR family regulator
LTAPPGKKDGIEVTSESLEDELVAIKDRLSAIETIASISNASVVKKYVEDHLKNEKGKAIMRACAEPRTRSQLRLMLGFNSEQALDHHLRPLREADLLRQRKEDNGTRVLEWSNLFRRLPKSTLRTLIGVSK